MVDSNSNSDCSSGRDEATGEVAMSSAVSSQLVLPPIDAVTDVSVTTPPDTYRGSTQEPEPTVETITDTGIQNATGPPETLSADEYVARVAELVFIDPARAGDRIGDLLSIFETSDDAIRRDISDTIEWLGYRRPQEFVTWSDGFVMCATADDPEQAYLGLRSLAQVANENETAAAKGLKPAINRLDTTDITLRTAALAVIAEVGARHTQQVSRADRSLANALTAPAARVRTVACIAAGNLLAVDPQRFPQTSMRLFAVWDDEDERVNTYAHVALTNFAIEQPAVIPNKSVVVDRLDTVSDELLGLKEGTTAKAVAEVTKVQAGY